MTVTRGAISGWILALFLVETAAAQTLDEQTTFQAQAAAGGAWNYRSIPCANGTVTGVGPRLRDAFSHAPVTPRDFQQSGVEVGIRFSRPWHFLADLSTTSETIVHYQGTIGNAIMQAERTGDRVQVCLTGFPVPRIDPATGEQLCNPDKDPRGFEFRVYDVRQRKAYIGPNSEHACGGA